MADLTLLPLIKTKGVKGGVLEMI